MVVEDHLGSGRCLRRALRQTGDLDRRNHQPRVDHHRRHAAVDLQLGDLARVEPLHRYLDGPVGPLRVTVAAHADTTVPAAGSLVAAFGSVEQAPGAIRLICPAVAVTLE